MYCTDPLYHTTEQSAGIERNCISEIWLSNKLLILTQVKDPANPVKKIFYLNYQKNFLIQKLFITWCEAK